MKSIYEKEHPNRIATQSGITFGRITAVDTARRLVTVKTFLGGGILDDMHIPACQWITIDGHPDGDESTTIPRKGTIGLVFFIGGEPFFFGGIKPINKSGSATTGKDLNVKLKEGDKIYSTDAGNYLLIRASGVVQIFVNDSLGTVYSPKDGRISHVCKNYQISTDGGSTIWENLGAPLNLTKYSSEYAANLMRTSVVYEQKGYVSASIVYQKDIGPGIPKRRGVDVPLYKETISITGEQKKEIGPAGVLKVTKSPTGAYSIENLLSSMNISALGDFEFKNKTSSSSISAMGDIEVKNKIASASISMTGDIEVKNKTGSLSISSTGDIKIKNPLVNIEATKSGELSVDSSKAKLEMGKGKFELTGATGGLVDTFINTLTALSDMAKSLSTEVHIGNLGYPTAPPSNAADYVKAMTELEKLKIVLTGLKK